MRLPESFSGLFKNYAFQKIDTEKHAKMIIKTVLSRGSWDQILWIFDLFGKDKVREVFLCDYYGLQELPEPTRMLWGLIFLDEKSQKEMCTKESSLLERWRCRRTTPR